MTLDLNTKNFAETRLVRDVDRRATVFIVENADILPTPPFRVVLEYEVAEVGRKSGNKLLDVERGMEGTKARQHSKGSIIKAIWTDGMLKKLSSKVEEARVAKPDPYQEFLHVRGITRFG